MMLCYGRSAQQTSGTDLLGFMNVRIRTDLQTINFSQSAHNAMPGYNNFFDVILSYATSYTYLEKTAAFNGKGNFLYSIYTPQLIDA